MNLGERVRAVRRERGLSVEKLAVGAGVSFSLIQRIERGGAPPRADRLARIADVLGVSVEDLLSEEVAS